MIVNSRKFIISTFIIYLLCITLYAPNALAGFSLDRIRLTFTNSNLVQTLLVKADPGARPALLQVNAVSWSQKDGKDITEPTKDLVISPPFMKIMPGKTQILRIGLRAPLKKNQEASYRIFIKEVTPRTPDEKGVAFRLNMSVPAFILPATQTYSAAFKLNRTANNKYNLNIKNTGNTHIQILKIQLTDGQNKTTEIKGSPVYILPESTTEIPIVTDGLSGNKFHLVAVTDAEDLAQDISISS